MWHEDLRGWATLRLCHSNKARQCSTEIQEQMGQHKEEGPCSPPDSENPGAGVNFKAMVMTVIEWIDT